jgi:hypothetical protein
MNVKKTGKRLLLISLLSSFTMAISYGQATVIILLLGEKVASEEFYLSIDGALNISSFVGLEEWKAGTGVNYGLGTHIKLGEKWHLKPEFKPLSHKKARYIIPISEVPGEITIEESKLNLNYIDVPVLLQYNITPKIFVSAGPQISFLTGASQNTFGTMENGLETSLEIDTESFFNNINISFPVEIGYSISLGNKRTTSRIDINIFARYEYGFMEIFKDPEADSLKISLFQIGLSLPFIKSPEELLLQKNKLNFSSTVLTIKGMSKKSFAFLRV